MCMDELRKAAGPLHTAENRGWSGRSQGIAEKGSAPVLTEKAQHI